LIFDDAVHAIIHGDAASLTSILEANPDLIRARSSSEHHATLLHYVAANGVEDELQITPPNIVEITRILLDAGADVNATCDVYGGGAMTLGLLLSSCHPAAAGSQADIAEVLVKAGADTTGALDCAIDWGYTIAAKRLADIGLPVTTPRQAAVVGTVADVEQKLAGTTEEHALEQALTTAAGHGRRDIVEFLLTKNPDLSVRDAKWGNSAIGMARYEHPAAGRPHGSRDIALLLRGWNRFAPAEVKVERRPDGAMVLSSPRALDAYPASLGRHLMRWADRAPMRPFLLERKDGSWGGPTYADALAQVRSIGQWFLDRGLTAKTPVLLLSDNSVAHAIVQLAAMHVGVPAAPVSPAYSLASKDHAKLRAVVEQLGPGAVFYADDHRFEPALTKLPPIPRLAFAEALKTSPTAAVEEAFARVGPDTIAKILFTSGSTGSPKGVVNTHRMLCSNQEAIARNWLFLERRAPVVVDWLPWSHTFGGNHNFNMILRAGGTLYIDSGKPAPGLFDQTIAALKEISPTMYFNVPRGFELLAGALERDAELAETFFRELDILFYAAAALPQATWTRLSNVAERHNANVSFVAAWGSTETSPLATQVHWSIDRAGVIGLPAPGIDLKLAAVGTKLELRVRGPNITPGSWQRGDVIPAALDEDGFLPTGDAGRLEDPQAPDRGVVFDGRLAENFKLASGTWVAVGELRVMLLDACAPLISDAVIAGENRDALGVLLFPAPGADAAAIQAKLEAHNAKHPANSHYIARARLLGEPPSIDAGEITDKGYLNQRAVLDRRQSDVSALFAEDCAFPDVIDLMRRASR
jgi:feruloyl-CoA synthase